MSPLACDEPVRPPDSEQVDSGSEGEAWQHVSDNRSGDSIRQVWAHGRHPPPPPGVSPTAPHPRRQLTGARDANWGVPGPTLQEKQKLSPKQICKMQKRQLGTYPR